MASSQNKNKQTNKKQPPSPKKPFEMVIPEAGIAASTLAAATFPPPGLYQLKPFLPSTGLGSPAAGVLQKLTGKADLFSGVLLFLLACAGSLFYVVLGSTPEPRRPPSYRSRMGSPTDGCFPPGACMWTACLMDLEAPIVTCPIWML